MFIVRRSIFVPGSKLYSFGDYASRDADFYDSHSQTNTAYIMANYDNSNVLVDTQWLTEHLNDSNLVIIETDLDSKAYEGEHIPKCIFLSTFALLLPNLRTNFNIAAMENLLSDSGLSNDSTVVAVHRNYVGTSGWIFWLLKTFGHQDVRILDGGFTKWQQEGRSTTDRPTAVTKTNYQIKAIDYSLRISGEEVKQHVQRQDALLLDVRTPQEYRGEIYLQKPPKKHERAGHIPSAVNFYYELAHNDDGTFKTASQLQQLYSDAGVTADRLIIPYCAIGARSAHTWFILKYLLGYAQVKNYDGSWNEWSKLEDAPIA